MRDYHYVWPDEHKTPVADLPTWKIEQLILNRLIPMAGQTEGDIKERLRIELIARSLP